MSSVPILTQFGTKLAEQSRGPRIVSIADVAAQDTSWLLPGRMHRGALSIVEGDPSAGKSCFLSELASTLTSGRAWLGRPKSQPVGVLWLTSEEDAASTIRPRLVRAGANLDMVKVIETNQGNSPERVLLPSSIRWLRDATRAYSLGLIILDPLVSYVPPEVVLTDDASVRACLDPASSMCRDEAVSICMVRQLRKDRSGPRMTHGLGGMALSASARSILQIDRPDGSGPRRVLRAVKCSPGPEARPLTYSLLTGDGPPLMVGTRELGEEEDDAAGDLADVGERHTRDIARDLLQTLLRDGWMRTSAIFRLAEECGVGQRTLWKVKAELRCHFRRVGDGEQVYYEWGPPGSADPPPSPPVQTSAPGGKAPRKPRKPRKTDG